MNKLTVFAIGAGLLLISAAAAAEMYRWVDSEGKVHYSDRPTPGSAEVQVRVPGDSPVPAVAEDGNAPVDAAAEPVPEDDATQVRSQLCDQAKQRLASYEQADGLYVDEAGGRRDLSMDERVDAIVKARRSVKDLCEAPPA